MENKDNSERIERFLREQMTPEESEAFMNDLKKDKELREEAQMMALLIKEMKEEQAKENEVLRQRVMASKTKSKNIRMIRWAISIAAMIVLLFGAAVLWNRQAASDPLFAQYYTSYDTGRERGGDDAVKNELAELFNKIESEKDVTPIIARLQTIYDKIQSNDEHYSEYSYYENDIAWYLALAYIKDHNFGKAEELLEPLKERDDSAATELLEAIKSRK